MNKLIKVAEHFVTIAKQQKAELAEAIVDKYEAGNTGTEFDAFLQHRRQLESAISGLELLQWKLGKTGDVKACRPGRARKLAKTLRKELMELWRCTDEGQRDSRRALDLAWQFVVDQSTGRKEGTDAGLAIFDDAEPVPVS